MGSNSRGRPLGRWKDTVKEYILVYERGITKREEFEKGKKECLHSERQRLFCHDHPLERHYCREQGISAIYRQIDRLNPIEVVVVMVTVVTAGVVV